MKIIDAHTHIARIPGRDPEGSTYIDARNELLAQMKLARVNHALVLASLPGTWSPLQEELLSLVAKEKRLSVIGTYDAERGTQAEIDRLSVLIKDQRIKGIKIYLGYQALFPNDARLQPIYQLCDKQSVPVIFHTGDTFSMKGEAKVKYAHPLHIDDVAVDFPNLNIIIAHMGNPWLIDCAEVLYKNKNVYADCSGLVEYGNLNTAYGKLMRRRIRDLIAYIETSRKLLYGTDWPLTPMKPYIRFIRSIGMSHNDLEYVFWKNAAALFKLSV